MLQNYIDQQRLIKAIEARDGNFIKNVYRYHKDEYISLCKTIVINKAFIHAQRLSVDRYSDESVEFWRVIHYINNLHSARIIKDSGQSTGLIKLNILPKYYIDIIKSTEAMNNNVLEDFTPIWSTPLNLTRLLCVIGFGGGAAYGLYNANKYFEFKNQVIYSINCTYTHLKYLWADTPKRDALLYLFAAAACSVICFKIIKCDATKEAVLNFFDWSKPEHKHQNAEYIIEIGRKGNKEKEVSLLGSSE